MKIQTIVSLLEKESKENNLKFDDMKFMISEKVLEFLTFLKIKLTYYARFFKKHRLKTRH